MWCAAAKAAAAIAGSAHLKERGGDVEVGHQLAATEALQQSTGGYEREQGVKVKSGETAREKGGSEERDHEC